MLNRQKALLQLLRIAGGRMETPQLTKMSFLMRNETESRGGASFYDFVPRETGPYSFGLQQEAEKLVASGHLKKEGEAAWALGDNQVPKISDRDIEMDIMKIFSRYGQLSVDRLGNYISREYAHYCSLRDNSDTADPPTDLAVYTAGYEGKSIDAFLDGLLRSGIEHLIDVRMNPIARRYGFHRSTLSRLSSGLGIQYSHVPQLGIASQLRRNLESTADYEQLFEQYESTTLQSEGEAIDSVSRWIREKPSVLICMEADPVCCHRTRLANSVSQITKLPIIHLR